MKIKIHSKNFSTLLQRHSPDQAMAAKDRAVARLRILSIIALCCSFVACISLIIALATDHWQDIEVDRSGLRRIVEYKPELEQPINDDVLYFDRHRGLFRQCMATQRASYVIPDTICVRDLAFERSPVVDLSHVTSSSELDAVVSDLRTRTVLVITITVLMVVADVCALFASVTGFAALFTPRRRSVHTAAMSSVFLATVFAGSSMAIFHGLDFLERTELDVYVFPAAIVRDKAYNELRTHTKIRQGYSYYSCWLGVLLSGTAAILFLHVKKLLVEKLLPPHPGAVASSRSTSLFGGSSSVGKHRTFSRSTIGSFPSTPSNAYDMMESSTNTDVSERDGSRTPSSGDWNPYNELPRDYD